jgi:hypothetical protein
MSHSWDERRIRLLRFYSLHWIRITNFYRFNDLERSGVIECSSFPGIEYHK